MRLLVIHNQKISVFHLSVFFLIVCIVLLTIFFTPAIVAQSISGYFDYSMQILSSSPYSIYAPVITSFIGMEIPLDDFYIFISADVKLDFTGSDLTYLSESLVNLGSVTSTISLNETYFTYSGTSVKITVGNKTAILGSGYGINPTNFINPYIVEKQLISNKTTDWYIPVPIIGINLIFDSISVNGYILPFFIPNALPALNTKWSPSQLELLSNSPFSMQPAQKPGVSFENFQYGATLAADFSNITLTVSGFYGFTKNPVYEVVPSLPPIIVTPTYKRYWMVGLDISAIIFDHYTIWLESALSLPEYAPVLNAGIPGYSENSSLNSIAGIDRTFTLDNDDLYINMQFTHKYIVDYASNIIENEHIFGSLLVVEYRINNMMYTIRTSLYFPDLLDFSDNKTFVLKPSFLYKPVDNLSIELGYILIEGSSDSLIGQYSDNDSFLLQIIYNY